MSGLQSYTKTFGLSSDSIFSGVTEFDEEDLNSLDDLHLISEESKLLKVQEIAKKYHIDEKSLRWKIDLHVIPPFIIVFFLSYLNRSFGVLQIEQIYKGLHITQFQFFMSYVAFFIPYIIGQFFANSLLQFIKPHGLLSVAILLYGSISFGTGFTQNYASFVICQFLHGLFQSFSESSIFYILSHYYTKRESQPRFSAIFSASCISGVFTTFIAYLVDEKIKDSLSTFHGWRWLLKIEGTVTMIMSILVFLIAPDFPEGASFLNHNETCFLIEKLKLYYGESGYDIPLNFKDVYTSTTDPMIYLPALASIGVGYCTTAYSLFSPVFVLQVVGGGISHANELSIFPWITAFFWSNISSYVSNKWVNQHRGGFFLLNVLLMIVGGGMMYSSPTLKLPDNLKYSGCFLFAMGAFTAMPIMICWASTNLCGHLRKSIGISLQISCSSLGGLLGIFTFYDDSTRYSRGFLVGFLISVSSLILCFVYLWIIAKQNRLKRTVQYKNQFSEKPESERVILGDKNPSIDYLY